MAWSESAERSLERENERLRRENELLRQRLIDRDKQAEDLEKQTADLEKQAADLLKQVADLERQVGLKRQNSVTSSKPPSSDGLAGGQRERGRKRKSCRKPGGQSDIRGTGAGWLPRMVSMK